MTARRLLATVVLIVHVRGWPGRKHWKPPRRPAAYAERLGDRVGLVLVAAAALGAAPEHFGLGANLEIAGRSVLGAGVIVPDDLGAADLAAIEGWAAASPVDTLMGPVPWTVVTSSAFFHPYTGTFVRRAYSGAGPCIGADLGRTFGLAAEHWHGRSGEHVDWWEVWLPGWGKEHERGRWKRNSPHRPALWILAQRVGWRMRFAPVDDDNGKRVRGRLWTGQFIDVLRGAYTLDGDRSATFAEHRVDLGLDPAELPLAVTTDAEGAARMAAAVRAVHELALTLDERMAEWFTTPRDRAERRGRVDPARVASPGTLAGQILARTRVRAPMDIFALSDDEHRAWCESDHGGWCADDPRFRGVEFEGVSADVHSCFPLVAHLIGWWELLCAVRIDRENVTEDLRRLCERAVEDPLVLMDPDLWRRFGLTLAQVKPAGEIYPVEVEDAQRPDGRLEFVPTYAVGRSLYLGALDVLAAAVLSRRVPDIVFATAYAPIGRQRPLRRRLPVLPGLVLDSAEDPVLALVRHRRERKDAGDIVGAGQLRVLVNGLVYGILCRFDDLWVKVGREWKRTERPGPWSCMPIASSVTAGSHLLLAVFDRLVSDRGGAVAYRDTDSAIVPASPAGGVVTLPDGSTVRELSWAEIDEIVAAFAPLAPAPDWPMWDVKRGTTERPLRSLVFGPKRHYETVGADLVERTETTLGGYFGDPATMTGRADDGGRRWTRAAALAEIAYARARAADPTALRPEHYPWDEGQTEKFPALRRLMVKTPELARSLPAVLGARPGTRYVETTAPLTRRGLGNTAVALDPGGDLDGWRGLGWVGRDTRASVRVSTDPGDVHAVVIDSLDARVVHWTEPPTADPFSEVMVTPLNVSVMGRVSGVIDAVLDGSGDLAVRRPVYDDGERLSLVQSLARSIGPRPFSRRTGLAPKVAERAALGRPISSRNVARALVALGVEPSTPTCGLDGCEEPVPRPNARYCTAAHRKVAVRVRAREAQLIVAHPHEPDSLDHLPRCSGGCGTVLIGAAARRGTCSRCAEVGR
jgi:hypothetical protein